MCSAAWYSCAVWAVQLDSMEMRVRCKHCVTGMPVTVTHINVTFIRYNITACQYITACHQAQLERSPKDSEPWSITYGHALVCIHESLASLPINARHCLALAEAVSLSR